MADNRKKPANGGNDRQKGTVNKPKGQRRGKKTNTALWAWLAIGVVVAIIATLVLVKTLSGPPAGAVSQPVTATMYNQITHIPASVYDQVGVTSQITVNPPAVLHGQPPLTYLQGGKQVPGSFYWGAEYCPYCAATRWGMIAAYSRFGGWVNDRLYTMNSAPNDIAPNTPTFSFYKTKYYSPYIVFKTYEVVGPINNGVTLEVTPPKEQALLAKYNPKGYFPFLDIGNMVFTEGTAYDPNTLAGQKREDIAANLTDPTNPVTQAIIATANYMSAGICATNGAKPASVCQSSGVQAAAKALHLTF